MIRRIQERKTAVIVAGSWGLALSRVLAEHGRQVTLWTRKEMQVEQINTAQASQGSGLAPEIRATTSMEQALFGADSVLVVAPSAAMREIAARIRPHLPPDALLIHATKGFEAQSLKRMSEVLAEELPAYDSKRIVALSGPSHAEEVAHRRPTTVVVASHSIAAAEEAQDLLLLPWFRVYTNPDLVGVEVGGALKNIIALAAGITDGLQFGDNAKAALLTRGLAEISRLGTAMGANPLTFAGLAGLGDLVVTCTSKLSRNWKAGNLLAQGKPLTDVLAEIGMVVEGVRTTESALALARRFDVRLPIAEQLAQVLFAGKPAVAAAEDLMGRSRGSELEEIDA
jgi:glycerol-3-phosphate dehydrogenase (NAD(P)+)